MPAASVRNRCFMVSSCCFKEFERINSSAALRSGLASALEEYGVPHAYIVFPHSGHGLQNDNKRYAQYMDKVVEYLDKYMEE